jgi:hypothetical protein
MFACNDLTQKVLAAMKRYNGRVLFGVLDWMQVGLYGTFSRSKQVPNREEVRTLLVASKFFPFWFVVKFIKEISDNQP